MNQDADQLRLLSIFHYVVAGITGLFALFPIIHVCIGLLIVFAPDQFNQAGPQLDHGAPTPAWFGWLLIAFAGTFIIIGWIFAILIFIAGRCLAARRRYMFCLVMACIECLFMPFGTVLGVFTIIVLMRESVKLLFVTKNSSGDLRPVS